MSVASCENDVIEKNRGLVLSITKLWASKFPLLKDDIESAGMEGLLIAHRRFNPLKGYQFSTFAHKCITGYILNEINSSSLIHVPANVAKLARSWNQIHNKLSHDVGRRLSKEEIIEINGWGEKSAHSYELMHNVRHSLTSLDADFNDEHEIASKDSDPFALHLMEEQKEHIKQVLKILLDRDRKILMAYFGIDGPKIHPIEIAKKWGCTKANIHLLINKSIALISSYFSDKNPLRD